MLNFITYFNNGKFRFVLLNKYYTLRLKFIIMILKFKK